MLYFCVFCRQEKRAPDLGVQVAGLFLETVTRPFPLASSAFLLALREDGHRGQLEVQTIKRTPSQEANMLFQAPELQFKLHLLSTEAVGRVISLR